MITLSTFQQFESLEQELKNFLIKKCKEYDEAYGYHTSSCLEEDFDCWEFWGAYLNVFFGGNGNYSYQLPLDLMFDPEFEQKLRERVLEEKRQANLKREIEVKRQAEAKRQEKIEMLKMLMKEFPDVVKDGI